MEAGAEECGIGEGKKGQLRTLQLFPEQGVDTLVRSQESIPAIPSAEQVSGTRLRIFSSSSVGVSLFSESSSGEQNVSKSFDNTP